MFRVLLAHNVLIFYCILCFFSLPQIFLLLRLFLLINHPHLHRPQTRPPRAKSASYSPETELFLCRGRNRSHPPSTGGTHARPRCRPRRGRRTIGAGGLWGTLGRSRTPGASRRRSAAARAMTGKAGGHPCSSGSSPSPCR